MILAERHTAPARFGGIEVLPDGRLFTAYTEGKSLPEAVRIGRFDDPWVPEYLVVRHGRGWPIEWDEPRTVMELPMGLGVWGGCKSRLDRDGAIHLVGLRFLKWVEDIENHAPGEMRSDAFHLASRDGGATWERPKRVDYGHDYSGALMDLIQLESGRLLLLLCYRDVTRTDGQGLSKVCYSDDGGRTWYADATELHVPSGGARSHSGALEPVAVLLADGRVWMLLRTQFGRFYESFSDDGRTWTEPQPTRFKSPNAPCAVTRLQDGRLILVWNNTQGPPFGGRGDVHGSRHVLNAAVSHDDGQTWHGYREFARQARPDVEDDQVSYSSLTALPDGKVLVAFVHVPGDWEQLGVDCVMLNPDRLDETSDREDFSSGLAGWSLNGTAGASVVQAEGENVLRLQSTGAKPLGAERNFPFAPRGTLRFEIRRDPASEGVDLVLDETFWRPNDRRPDAAMDISLGADEVPSDEWVPVAVAWDVAEEAAQVSVGGHQRRVPVTGSPPGICYLTFCGRAVGAEAGALLVRRLETAALSSRSF